jgi:hypothetical protein
MNNKAQLIAEYADKKFIRQHEDRGQLHAGKTK